MCYQHQYTQYTDILFIFIFIVYDCMDLPFLLVAENIQYTPPAIQ